METVVKSLFGVNSSHIPIITLEELDFPSAYVGKFDPYCGAGGGFFNDIVPETIFGIPISPACFVHDYMWREAEATWADFHYSNNVFHVNINNLLRYQSDNKFMFHLRLYRAVTYFNAVDTLGSEIFWRMKRV